MDVFFLQQLINGLTLGAVYGLIAIGYTMVYGIIGMINFLPTELQRNRVNGANNSGAPGVCQSAKLQKKCVC